MTPVKYTPLENPKNTYQFKFTFSHGDADLDTKSEIKFRMTEAQLIEYVDAVKKQEEHINDYNAGADVPEPDREVKVGDFYIPDEYDKIYSDNMCAPHIDSIIYYDQDGVAFNVEIE